MTIEVGMKFQRVGSDLIATVVKIEEDGSNVVELSNGKNFVYSASTLKDKRRFTLISEDAETVAEEVEETVEAAPVVETVEQPKTEKAKEEKPKKAKKSADPGVGLDLYNYAVSVVEKLGGVVFASKETNRFRSFKANNKMFAAVFYYGSKGVTIGVRSKSVEGLNIAPTSTMKHLCDYVYKYSELNDKAKDEIEQILTASYNWQISR